MNKKYQCSVCGYIYDPAAGDPSSGVRPGLRLRIADDWFARSAAQPRTNFGQSTDLIKTE